MQLVPLTTAQSHLLSGVRHLWKEGHLCDVNLRSRTGTIFAAHRVIISASSAALAALLSGQFSEGNMVAMGTPIQLDVLAEALNAALHFIYGSEQTLQPHDALGALQLAHTYGLDLFAAQISSALPHHLNASLAAQVLAQCDLLGYADLERKCEQYIIDNFEESFHNAAFIDLPATSLGRVVKAVELEISREEVVLQALFNWHEKTPGRGDCLSLLLHHPYQCMHSMPPKITHKPSDHAVFLWNVKFGKGRRLTNEGAFLITTQ